MGDDDERIWTFHIRFGHTPDRVDELAVARALGETFEWITGQRIDFMDFTSTSTTLRQLLAPNEPGDPRLN